MRQGRLAYTRATPDPNTGCGAGVAGVGTIAADGTDQHDLVVGNYVDGPAWSPDGRYIAYMRSVSGGEQAEIIPSGGGSPTVIPNAADAQFNGAGDALAYLHLAGPNVDGIALQKIVTAGGRLALDGQPRLLPLPGASWPTWAPDGTRLAVVQTDMTSRPSTTHLLIGDVNGSGFRQVSGTLDVDTTLPQGIFWSPDGRTVLFLAHSGSNNQDQPWLYDTTTSALTLLRRTGATSAAWAPSGRSIALVNYLVHPAITLLTPTGTKVRDLDVGNLYGSFDVTFSADESDVLFVTQPMSGSCTFNLYAAATNGSGVRQLTSGGIMPGRLAVLGDGPITRTYATTPTETGVTVSEHTFQHADTAVIARSDDYADALAGAPLAGANNGPLLLNPSDHLDPDVDHELHRLGTTNVMLLGGGNALDPSIEQQLTSEGIMVTRIAGNDRYTTAAAIAHQLPAASAAYIVEGYDPDPNLGWPDAAAVSALAAYQRRMILLVNHDTVPDATMQALKDAGTSSVTIIGGTSVVSSSSEQQLRNAGLNVTRVAGPTRYDTSTAIADQAAADGMTGADVALTPGTTWAESLLVGAASAATAQNMLTIADTNPDTQPAARWLDAHTDSINHLTLIAPPSLISPATAVDVSHHVG